MRAFHNDQKVKDLYLNRVLEHQKADEIIKGIYWENGKGCAVGCTIHSADHNAYETELSIPEWLARVEDRIFENLPNEKTKTWPAEFLSAINLGANLDKIKPAFLIFVCESALETFDHDKFPLCKKAIDGVIALWRLPENKRTIAAAYVADAAVADAAANAGDLFYAVFYATSAAASAAAASVAVKADVADVSYAVSYAAAAASYAAAPVIYVKFADKLLELIRECKTEEDEK